VDRFYAPTADTDGEVVLPADEAHHARNVLRKQVGDRVELFDGRGRCVAGQVVRCEKRETTVRVEGTWQVDPPPAGRLVLATALPKGDRARFLVEKATELGVARLVPLHTRRSVVAPRDAKLDRLRAAVVAACKQCGRNRLMDVDEPLDWTDLLAAPPGRLLVADREGERLGMLNFEGETTLAVGPEGGLVEEELVGAREVGARFVSLGSHVLRVETACLAAAAVFSASSPISSH
jgi:16S rRNA (uracil1498-N3)-methyltransferase